MNSHMFVKIAAEDARVLTSGPRTLIPPIIIVHPFVFFQVLFSLELFAASRPRAHELTFVRMYQTMFY